jgi:drug/metabolite transporter (DMT)-like permease
VSLTRLSYQQMVAFVPPCTALIAWPLLGETLGPSALAGMVLIVLGVVLAVYSCAKRGPIT